MKTCLPCLLLFVATTTPVESLQAPAARTAGCSRPRPGPGYEFVPSEEGAWRAPNAGRGIDTWFDAGGITITPASGAEHAWSLGMRFAGHGRGGATVRARPAEPTVLENRLEYRRGAVVEWYANDERGLEQGFTLSEPSAGSGALELVLELATSLAAEVTDGGRGLRFAEEEGRAVLRYAGLAAWDGKGRDLAAWLEIEGATLRILVDDTTAEYPVTVDPLCFLEQAKLTASDAAAGDEFGWSVSVSGATALVGSYRDDDNGSDSGAAYVLTQSGTVWTEQAKLTASDGSAGDRFGFSISVSGDTALVSSYRDDHSGADSGSAYVFTRSGVVWTEQAKLTASDPAAGDEFGRSVSVFGDTALVGSILDDDNGTDSGSAYVFARNGTVWTQQAKLTASDGVAGDWFGQSVSVSGDTAVVGSYGDDDNGPDSGSAYVFTRNGTVWTEQAKLNASDGAAGNVFGVSVSVSGDTAIVGSSGDDENGSNSGSAYMFTRNGTVWTEQTKLTASDGAAEDRFGHSVSVSGDRALVGSYLDDDNGTDSGSAYVYAQSGTVWTEQTKLLASDGAASDFLGVSVSVSGATALVGSYGDDDSGTDSGAAYVFLDPPPPVVYCTAGVSASGCQAAMGATGIPSASASSGFSLLATGVEGSKDGLFFFGANGRQANPWGNGTSFQCVVPPVNRAGMLAGTGTVGQCDGAFAQDLNALWCPSCPKAQKNPGACATVQAQLWYRDPQSTSNQTTSLSDAIEFTLDP